MIHRRFHPVASGCRFGLLASIFPWWLAFCPLVATAATAPGPNTFPPVAFENVKDYGMMWWRSGWRGERVWQIKTSRYAMTFDSDSLNLVNIFPLPSHLPETEALVQPNELSFPASVPVSSLACTITSAGSSYPIQTLTTTAGSSHLVDSGKFFQRRWQKVTTTSGPTLNPVQSGLEICAWPDRVSITCRVIPTADVPAGQLDLTLNFQNIYQILTSSGLAHAFGAADGSGYVVLKSSGTTTLTTDAANTKVSVSTTGGTWLANEERSVGLVIYPTMNVASTLAAANTIEGGQLTVTASQVAPSSAVLAPTYDLDRGYFNVPLRSDATASDENRIERTRVTVTNTAATPHVARFAFTKASPPNIPGVTCIIRDLDGNPLGIPVQLSKNWHVKAGNPERWDGYWFHGLTMFTVPANTTLNFEVLMAGQNYGGVPAASHAQLSIVGYTENGNQQWEEAAIGCWGETFCYDPDSHLASAIGTDSRPLLLLNSTGGQKGWTANYGGCDFLRYYDGANTRRFQKRIRTHYQRYGPNLTDVTYAGLTDDSKIEFQYGASLYRSNDFSRDRHRIRYDVKNDAPITRMVFFQLASDNYNYGGGNTHAYGYANQLAPTAEWTTTDVTTPTELTGSLPWFSTLNCPLDPAMGQTGATRGFIIRSWTARINGQDGVKPYFVSNGSRFDLVPPPGVTSLKAGDYVEAEIERVYFGQDSSAYYGGDANFTTALQSYGNTHNMVIREAVGNNLAVSVAQGTLEKSYPIQIRALNDTAQFSVARGIGYVPMTFTGLSDYRDPRLEEWVGAAWVPVNQAVHGKDFWQAEYEPTSGSWQITFNVKLDGAYQDPAALRDAPVTRTFRLRQVIEPVIAPVIWSSGAATTSWALGSNWVGGVAPVSGDDVMVSADGAVDPTAYNGVTINSLTLTGAASLSLSGLKVGAGGVYNTMVASGQSLFLNGTTTLLADQAWGGTRTIFMNQAAGAFKLTFNGSFARFDTNSAGWSGGLDLRTSVGMGGNYAVGAITPFGIGTVTLINQRSNGLTSSSPSLGVAGAAANNSLANANTIANNIALSDPGSGNFTINQTNDSAPSIGHFYILSGNITGAVNSARTLNFTNTHGSAAATPATFVLTGANTYAAQTIIGTNTTLQIGNGGTTGTLGAGSISNSGTLAFNRSDALSMDNVIVGSGSLQQRGSGTLNLTGSITASSTDFFTFSGTGVNNAGIVLGGSNTFTLTRVVVKDTSLTIANNGAVNAPNFPRVSLGDSGGSGAAVYLLDGINLNVKVVDSNNTDITGPMAFTVGMKTAGTATFSGTASGNVAVDLHARNTGGTNNSWNFVAVSGATANFTGAIINTGTNAQASITKTGLGTVIFSGANTYGGDTTVEAGTLSLATARLPDASTVRIASGAVLSLTHGVADRVDNLYLNGVHQPAGTYGASTPGSYISGTGSLVVTNGPNNDAPLANDQTLATPMDTVTPLVLGGTDPEEATLAFRIVENPSHGTISGTAPNLNYMPATGFVGVDRLTFTVDDGGRTSNTATVLISVTPVTVAGLWQAYESAILTAPLNKELLLTSVQDGITIEQIRYDLGELVGTQVTASPKIAAYYAYPTTGINLPGIVAIHGGGQRATVAQAVYWASQGYACISINWGGNPLTDLAGGSLLPNTDWDQLAAGFTRSGVTQAIHSESTSPASFADGMTLFAQTHPFNNSYSLYSYAARRAMTYLAAQPNVNGNKLGVTGHSMGGVITVMTGTDARATCITPSVGGVVAAQDSYWPEIRCPTLFLEASNDWHAPFDKVVTSMALQAESVPQRLVVAPHFSHRFDTTAEAARVLWQKSHLTGSFVFPQTAVAQLDLTRPDGIPVLSVWPDESVASTVTGVDVYYGYDRDPLARFWRDGKAVKINGHWQAKCPVYDLNEPLVAFAVVTYDSGLSFTMQAGYTSPTRYFSLASEVRRVDPPDLAASGVRATEIRLPQIDDFARAYHDWYLLEPANTTYFEFWTRKLLDPSWAGPVGGELAFDVLTTSPGNVLGVKILVGQNHMNAQTYVATIPLPVNGTNSVSIPVGAFTHEITGAALANWGRLTVLGVMNGKRAKPADATLPAWTGSVPVLSNLRWLGGTYSENYLIHDVPKAWLIGHGLAATDAVALADSDGDGKPNWEEFIAGTHPLNGASLLKMESAGVAADRFVFKWQAVSGKTYRIETKTSLMDPEWTIQQTGIPGVAPECTGSVPISGTSGFIRVAVE